MVDSLSPFLGPLMRCLQSISTLYFVKRHRAASSGLQKAGSSAPLLSSSCSLHDEEVFSGVPLQGRGISWQRCNTASDSGSDTLEAAGAAAAKAKSPRDWEGNSLLLSLDSVPQSGMRQPQQDQQPRQPQGGPLGSFERASSSPDFPGVYSARRRGSFSRGWLRAPLASLSKMAASFKKTNTQQEQLQQQGHRDMQSWGGSRMPSSAQQWGPPKQLPGRYRSHPPDLLSDSPVLPPQQRILRQQSPESNRQRVRENAGVSPSSSFVGRAAARMFSAFRHKESNDLEQPPLDTRRASSCLFSVEEGDGDYQQVGAPAVQQVQQGSLLLQQQLHQQNQLLQDSLRRRSFTESHQGGDGEAASVATGGAFPGASRWSASQSAGFPPAHSTSTEEAPVFPESRQQGEAFNGGPSPSGSTPNPFAASQRPSGQERASTSAAKESQQAAAVGSSATRGQCHHQERSWRGLQLWDSDEGSSEPRSRRVEGPREAPNAGLQYPSASAREAVPVAATDCDGVDTTEPSTSFSFYECMQHQPGNAARPASPGGGSNTGGRSH
ncbi:hypothetical protein cyc_09218 [Cyclospora cayetanensis]|uniref:Uncharacterized protein n=1 Tax=Cyclospora cayetanensis TaxID=88456 RepID=A0A1D3CXJ5_9EIME|nr:hypothetical protein cyc_09218 [Cyclospora cayetanensis]